MSVFNEQRVIAQKIDSMLDTDYPKEKLFFFIGSDASIDDTNAIIQNYLYQNSSIHFFPFEQRRGKPAVINNLARSCLKNLFTSLSIHPKEIVFIITDANVILTPSTIFHLVKHFKNSHIALIDSNQMTRAQNDKIGIAGAEMKYISQEVILKHYEGLLGYNMLGPLGGCYAIRSNYFSPIPSNFLVDDFYLAMRVFEQGGGAINDLDAICYEPLPSEINVEYRRKRRISTGNFQNLKIFSHFLWHFNVRSYIFWSHKVLRWFGPFFLIGLVLGTIFQNYNSSETFYRYLLWFEFLAFAIVPLLDILLSTFVITFTYTRAWRYLIVMNIALLEGFWRFIKGVKSGIWQPTPRK